MSRTWCDHLAGWLSERLAAPPDILFIYLSEDPTEEDRSLVREGAPSEFVDTEIGREVH